jgi:hypothetical protein
MIEKKFIIIRSPATHFFDDDDESRLFFTVIQVKPQTAMKCNSQNANPSYAPKKGKNSASFAS